MPSALRDRARELWGREVVVLTDAVVAADGAVADLQALDIRPAATAQAADAGFDKTFGLMRGAWDSDAVAQGKPLLFAEANPVAGDGTLTRSTCVFTCPRWRSCAAVRTRCRSMS